MPDNRKLSFFVTGTDTGVGKTLVTTAMLHALARHHVHAFPRIVGMKPVAAGTARINGTEANDDVLALRAASNCRVPPGLDNPVLLPDPVSPHIAAARAGVRIDIAHVVACHRALLQQADAVVVEGAGGFMVPLTDTETGADLAVALALPVVLVVGLRLGCLNHALLTAEAIRARGLTLAGWVANQVDPALLAPEDNLAFLQQRLNAPLLAHIGWQAAPDTQGVAFDFPDSWTARP